MGRDEDKRRRRRHRLEKRRQPRAHRPEPEGGGNDLLREITVAVLNPHPLGLLAKASGFVTVHDPRTDRLRPQSTREVDWPLFLGSLVDVDLPETTALLAAFSGLALDEVSRAACRREVARRRHSLPAWLDELGAVRVAEVVRLTEPFGDTEQYWIDLRWPDDTPLTLTALIERTEGHVLVDAQVVPAPADALRGILDETVAEAADGGGGMASEHPDHAEARAAIEAAIEHSAMLFPPVETDTWPMARPLMEWALRLLPEGGSFEMGEITIEDGMRLASDFVVSAHGQTLGRDARDIAADLCWYANFTDGDPLRWSPRKLGLLLVDWWARKIMAPAAYHRAMPDVLRALVRWSGEQRGTADEVVAASLAAIDELVPAFKESLRTPRTDTASILAQVVAGVGDFEDDAEQPAGFDVRASLVARAGSDEALDGLVDLTLPDEDLDLTEVPDDVRGVVTEIDALLSPVAVDLFGVEFRTACRRLLSALGRLAPQLFRRKASTSTAAFAITLMIARDNEALGGSGVTAKAVAERFGLSTSSTQRHETMRNALVEAGWVTGTRHDHHLGRVDLLTSAGRQTLIQARDFWAARGWSLP